jgi:DsbC/DsbD-like thiol-disulfide interchange protein
VPVLAACAGLLIAVPGPAAKAETSSPWHQAHNSRVRLVAGAEGGKTFAGVEIELKPGWKTYWRTPGDSGGLPPNFTWKASSNLLSSVVLYPAPKRLKDAAGDAIGYADHVVFPVRIVAADSVRPVELVLELEYGICKDICVPVEVRLELTVPAGVPGPLPAGLADALDQVPRVAGARRAKDPSLVKAEAQLEGENPRLLLEADYPGGLDGADAFIEGPDGVYIPQPQVNERSGGPPTRRAYVVDLASGVDLADIRGKRLTVTMTGKAGASQVHWPLD